MKRLLILLLLILPSLAYAQRNDLDGVIHFYDKLFDYVENPDKGDKQGLKDIERARKDIANNKVVFCTPAGNHFGDIRCMEELEKVAKENGFDFTFDILSGTEQIIVNEQGESAKQTKVCYGAYMTKYIRDTFGEDVRERIYRRADSLYISNIISQNKVVAYLDCDKGPQLGDKGPDSDPVLRLDVNNKEFPLDYSKPYLFLDIKFIIELDGTTNSHEVTNHLLWVPGNEKYYEELAEYAIKMLKKIDNWQPGQLSGHNVRTEQDVRVVLKGVPDIVRPKLRYQNMYNPDAGTVVIDLDA